MELDFSFTELDGQTFGHNVYGNFLLRYKPKRFTKFVDTPKLIWFEKITMVQHDKNQWWYFETNQYTRNPFSPTMRTWYERYVFAYDKAAMGFNPPKGKSELLNDNKSPVKIDAIGKGLNDPGEKANAVRNYLDSNGGYLQIQIHDVPAIVKPTVGKTMHKERLLQFDCGVEGLVPNFQCEQYLVVNSGTPQSDWEQVCEKGWKRDLDVPAGASKESPPPDVSIDKGSPTTPAYGRYL